MALLKFSTVEQLGVALAAPDKKDLQLSVAGPRGGWLRAFFVEDKGCLMYLRYQGDSGFSSRNPDNSGDPTATHSFTLENGQVDEFPASWFYPRSVVEGALREYALYGNRPERIQWHAD
jgi:Immunity protein Imm1